MSGFADTLAKITTRGYWRVVVHPPHPPRRVLASLPVLERLLTQSTVSLTGWDYPHVPIVQNENNEMYRVNDALEAWLGAKTMKYKSTLQPSS